MLCGYNEEFSKDVINIILNDIDDILKKFDRDIPIYDITTELNLKDKDQKEIVMSKLFK